MIEIEMIKVEKPGYPCLKISDIQVVLFTAPQTGFVVNPFDCNSPVGNYSNVWAEHMFVPFDGTITLKNK